MKKLAPKLYEGVSKIGADWGFGQDFADGAINIAAAFFPTVNEVAGGVGYNGPLKDKMLVGAGFMKPYDVKEDLDNYVSTKFNRSLADAKDNYLDLVKVSSEVKPADLDKRLRTSMKDMAEPYRDLEAAWNAAIDQGYEKKDLYPVLLDKSVPKEVIKMLSANRPIPFGMIFSKIQDTARAEVDRASIPKGLAKTDAEKETQRQVTNAEATRIRERWLHKLEQMRNLMEKYRDVPLDKIESGEY